MTLTVASLPLSLLLLVHLYILDYPDANQPEYDHDIFNPVTRGLRDRTKTMEDITYFLVSSIVGKKDSRLMLPSYPCAQPAESTAFRVSLTKYLDGLRNQYRDANKDATTAPLIASMWKDTLVRKSLLEECSGERFEQLILCLSTHTILHRSKSSSIDVVPSDDTSLLRSQPAKYASLVASLQIQRAQWKRIASSLLQRQNDLLTLQTQLRSPDGTSPFEDSPYKNLSTVRAHALAESKYQDLWRSYASIAAERSDDLSPLAFFIKTIGLKLPSLAYGAESRPSTFDSLSSANQPVDEAIPSPLPVSAALHPSYLKKLKQPILPVTATSVGKDTQSAPTPRDATGSLASASVVDVIVSEGRTHQGLVAALAAAKRTNLQLNSELPDSLPPQSYSAISNFLSPSLWENTSTFPDPTVNFGTDFSPALVESLSLSTPDSSSKVLESKIDHIRRELLPSFPDIPLVEGIVRPASTLVKAQLEQPPSESAAKRTQATNVSNIPQVSSIPAPNDHLARKSIRHSLMQTPRRTTGWMSSIPRKRSVVVNDIVETVQDDSVSFDEDNPLEFSVVTPSHKLPPGTPLSAIRHNERALLGTGTVKRMMMPKASFAFPPLEPPSPTLSGQFSSSDQDDDRGNTKGGHDELAGQRSPSEEDAYDEGHSMTLRDILLQADTTTYELLGNETEALNEALEGWD